jgi:RNA polymerase sigma factor (sigma-70 family)
MPTLTPTEPPTQEPAAVPDPTARRPRRPVPPLTDDQRELLERPATERAINYWSARAGQKYPRRADEIRSAVILRVVQAARSFDPAIASWPTFVNAAARYGAIDGIRRRVRWGDALDHARPLHSENRRHAKFAGSSHQPEDDALTDTRFTPDESVADGGLVHLTRGLPPDHRRAVCLHYGRGLTMKAVADALRMSESRVSQLISDSLRLLREMRADEFHPWGGDRPVTGKEDGP